MIADENTVDLRSVGELLLDADLTSRAALWETGPDLAKARVRTLGEVIEAAADLWTAIPDPFKDQSMNRISNLADGLHRTHQHTGWPGAGDADTHLASIASSLSRAADLVQARQHPTAAPSRPGQLDAEAARTRLMHVLYVSSHGVRVALNPYIADLQRRSDARQSSPRGDSLVRARDARERIGAIERLAGVSLKDRWPSALAHEHRERPWPSRLEAALARWDLQAHRTLAGPPTVSNLEVIAQTQQVIAGATAAIGAAGAQQGSLDAAAVERVRPALAELGDSWSALRGDLVELRGRQARVDRPLIQAGNEVQAALREITHDRAGLATPEVMSDRVDLQVAAQQLYQSLTAAVDLAHVTRDALADPELTGGARGAHLMAHASNAAQTQAAWVDAGSLHQNRDVPLPNPVRDRLAERANRIVDTAISTDSSGLSLAARRTYHRSEPSLGRREEERAWSAQEANVIARRGCER